MIYVWAAALLLGVGLTLPVVTVFAVLFRDLWLSWVCVGGQAIVVSTALLLMADRVRDHWRRERLRRRVMDRRVTKKVGESDR